MGKKQKTTEESGSKVPAYIVTYSDMITLLLTFFVMLLSLASEQDPELVAKGRDSFIASIHGFGIGLLPGMKKQTDFGNKKIKYPVDEPDEEPTDRTIDAEQEKVRRLFDKVNHNTTVLPSPVANKQIDFTVTDIHFAKTSAVLNKKAKDFLSKFCINLQQASGSGDVRLCILGLAPEETSEKKQWTISAQRAFTVAAFIKKHLPQDSRLPVYPWGAGPGGQWTDPSSPVSKNAQILIAVMNTK